MSKKIFRTEKNKNYTVILNSVFHDKRISWGAKGVLGYALTKPDDWSLYISEVVKNGSDGKSRVSGYFKELRLSGYFDYVRHYEYGKIAKTEYIIRENPSHLEEIFKQKHSTKNLKQNQKNIDLKSENLIQENLKQEILKQEKQQLLNTDSLPNTEKPASLFQKIKNIVEAENMVSEDYNNRSIGYQNRLIMEKNLQDSGVLEQLQKAIKIIKVSKKETEYKFLPGWMKKPIGFEFLYVNWKQIEIDYQARFPLKQIIKKREETRTATLEEMLEVLGRKDAA